MSEQYTDEQVHEANSWFLNKRRSELEAWQKMPTNTKAELVSARETMNKLIQKDLQYEKILTSKQPTAGLETDDFIIKNTTKVAEVKNEHRPTYYVNSVVANDISEFRGQNPALDQKVSKMSTQELQDEYLLSLMKREGYEPGVKVTEDLQKFKQEFPSMTKRAELMPREFIENTYVLNQMKKQGYDPRVSKMKDFLNQPEMTEIKAEVENLVQHIRNPEMRERVAMKNKAPQVLKAHGIKY